MVLRTKLTPLGGKLVKYKKNFIVFESSTPGTYSFEIKKALFELSATGGGGGAGGSAGSHAWYGQIGGSASAFKGLVNFDKGMLTIVIGSGGTGGNGSGRNATAGTNGAATIIKFNNTVLITLGGGNGGGGTGSLSGANNGKGGVLTMGALKVASSTIRSNGQDQSKISLLGNGFGAGGDYRAAANGLPGTSGYVKIKFVK